MRTTYVPPSLQIPEKDEDKWKWAQQNFADQAKQMQLLLEVLHGRVSFGDGVDVDNLLGKWVSGTSHASADTEFTVTHNLGVIPIGFLVAVPPQSGFLYKGTTTWTTSSIYLKCSGTAQAFTIFILIPPRLTL